MFFTLAFLASLPGLILAVFVPKTDIEDAEVARPGPGGAPAPR